MSHLKTIFSGHLMYMYNLHSIICVIGNFLLRNVNDKFKHKEEDYAILKHIRGDLLSEVLYDSYFALVESGYACYRCCKAFNASECLPEPPPPAFPQKLPNGRPCFHGVCVEVSILTVKSFVNTETCAVNEEPVKMLMLCV